MNVLYSKNKTQKNKKFSDGTILFKNGAIYLRNDAEKVIDSIQLKPNTVFDEDELINFPGFVVQLQDKGQAEKLNQLKIKGSKEVFIPSVNGNSNETANNNQNNQLNNNQQVNQVVQKQTKETHEKQNNVQIENETVKTNTATGQDTLSEQIPIQESLRLIANKPFTFQKTPSYLQQLQQSIQQIKPKTPHSLTDLFKNSIQLITSELLIQILQCILSQKFSSNNSGLVMKKANLIQKTYDQKFSAVSETSWKLEATEAFKYTKNDLIIVIKDSIQFQAYIFNLSHYERKDADCVYLEPISSTTGLCDPARLKFKQDKNEIVDSIEFIHMGFGNEYQLLDMFMKLYQMQNFEEVCPVITEFMLKSLNKQYQVQTAKFQFEKEKLYPVMHNQERQLTLNTHQLHALTQIIEMVFQQEKRIHLIRGIFGSGKSQTIIETIIQLFYKINFNQFKILIVAITNTAVDNLVERLIATQLIPANLIQRLGTGSTNENVQDYLKNEYNQSCFVTATTCASISKVKNQKFSLLIIDEASQMRQNELLYIACNCKTDYFVLCGDPAQLPPIAEQKYLKVSVLEQFLENKFEVSNLWQQYRCNEYIASLSSSMFYGNQVETHTAVFSDYITNLFIQFRQENEPQVQPIVQQEEPDDMGSISIDEDYQPPAKSKIRIINRLNTKISRIVPPVTLINVQQAQDQTYKGSRMNQKEADEIVSFITHLVDSGQFLPSQIGVIVPYKYQCYLMQKKLPDCIMVATVDSFQGNEKDMIIIGLTRSSSFNEKSNTSFLESGCRVNVALTRAKMHLVIFKSYTYELTYPVQGQSTGYWTQIMDYCCECKWAFVGYQKFITYQQQLAQKFDDVYKKTLSNLNNVVQLEFKRNLFTKKSVELLRKDDEDKNVLENYEKMRKADDAERYQEAVNAFYDQEEVKTDGEICYGLDYELMSVLDQKPNPDGFQILDVLRKISFK
ncbi:DNA_helicase [Hexamita inflata]|uniref:DNA helicase n=1 Tax=Hexamita inflata TaxID=28002 RepID=A0AA86Q5D1_9EUKA|nr:DNA helicase [Hexamita inflata]